MCIRDSRAGDRHKEQPERHRHEAHPHDRPAPAGARGTVRIELPRAERPARTLRDRLCDRGGTSGGSMARRFDGGHPGCGGQSDRHDSSGEGTGQSGAIGASLNLPRLVSLLLLAALAVPSSASAQRDRFLKSFVQFHQALRGPYGDEGPQLTAQLDEMAAALAAWDGEIRDAESQLRPRLKAADPQTALQVHTILASLYLERGRFADALREFDADIAIDSTRAAFHRYKAVIYQGTARPAEAAAAYRTAWLREPNDPQNAYRLIVNRAPAVTAAQITQAVATLGRIEGELIRRQRAGADSPFRTC